MSSPLTAKETEVLNLYRAGISTRNIALALNISRGAVRDRLKNATRKLANQEAPQCPPSPSSSSTPS